MVGYAFLLELADAEGPWRIRRVTSLVGAPSDFGLPSLESHLSALSNSLELIQGCYAAF